MEKILVATDLSVNSISAIHFAYDLSQLKGATLVVAHVYNISKPKSWRTSRFEKYHENRRIFLLRKMNEILDRALKSANKPFINMEIDLIMHSNTTNALIKCAAQHKCKYMCISSHGDAKNKLPISLPAIKLITKISLPIFYIPKSYKRKSIESICYASDMTNYQKEISKFNELIEFLNAKLTLLHIIEPYINPIKSTLLETRLLKRLGISIKVKYAKRNSTNSLLEDIDSALKKIKPSVVIFFLSRATNYQHFLFSSEDATSLSFLRKTPLLILKR